MHIYTPVPGKHPPLQSHWHPLQLSVPVTHPPAGCWTSPGTAQTTAQFLHQCMPHSDSSLACVRRVVTLSCWNEVVLVYTPWSSTPLQCGHLTGQPVSLTQHFFVEFLQGTTYVCKCVCTSHGGFASTSHLLAHLCSSTSVTWSPFNVSTSNSKLYGRWVGVNMLRHSPDCTVCTAMYCLTLRPGDCLPYMRFLASQTPCVGPRHHSQPAWCWCAGGQHADPRGCDWGKKGKRGWRRAGDGGGEKVGRRKGRGKEKMRREGG